MWVSDSEPVFESHLPSLRLIGRGKVRDIYEVDDQHLLIVATDRLSAFDVVLPDPIPGKGEVLTALSNFWFSKTRHLVPNHLAIHTEVKTIPELADRSPLARRSVVVDRLTPLPIEAIVRGYLIGSGWKDYESTGEVCGIKLPEGLQQADRLPNPLYTPSSKAEAGEHDENIDFDATVRLVGRDIAERVRELSLQIYQEAAEYALSRGIIIADTKFEFGLNHRNEVILIDEVLTPDSSRFWAADSYRPGISPASFDKQFVRDYLDTLDWNKKPPAPVLPPDVIEKTAEKYREAQRRLTD